MKGSSDSPITTELPSEFFSIHILLPKPLGFLLASWKTAFALGISECTNLIFCLSCSDFGLYPSEQG